MQVAAGLDHTVGLKADGSVMAAGGDGFGQSTVDSWSNIIQVDAGLYYTIGLKSDGTLEAVGNDADGQCQVGGWDLF